MRGSRRVGVVAVLLALVGCSSSGGSTVAAPPDVAPVTFVVVGGDDVLGLVRRDQLVGSWPQLVFRDALPVQAAYVNLGQSGFSVIGAAAVLEPSFAELQPDVVAIWAGVTDAASGRAVADFRAGLDDLAALATRKANSNVLLATLPNGPADYNDVIREIASQRSLRLVELTGLVPAGTTDLSPEQNRAVADAFIAAYQR